MTRERRLRDKNDKSGSADQATSRRKRKSRGRRCDPTGVEVGLFTSTGLAAFLEPD